jgi:hypothetical protein
MLPDYPFATPPAAGETFRACSRHPLVADAAPFRPQPHQPLVARGRSRLGDRRHRLRAGCRQALLAASSWPAWRRPSGAGEITRIIVTHFHPDHLGLAAWLQELTGAPLFMTLGEYLTAHAVWHEVGGHGNPADVASVSGTHGLDAERCAALERRSGAYNRGVPSAFQTTTSASLTATSW